MRDTTVASRYAKALFLVTERRKETPRALEDLGGVHELLKPGTRASGFFSSPEVRLTDKRQALRRAFDGRALPIVVVFVDQQATRAAAPDAQSQQLAAAGRLTVTGERVDGRWKIAAVTPL